MKIIRLFICLIFTFTCSMLYAQGGESNPQIYNDGWGELRIGKKSTELEKYLTPKTEPSRLSLAAAEIFEKDSGYTINLMPMDLIYNADMSLYSSCFGEKVQLTQLCYDSLLQLSSLTIYFQPSSAEILAKKLSAQFKTPALTPLSGQPNTYKKTWTNGENKIMLFSQAKIDGMKIPLCFIRFWKGTKYSPEADVNTARKSIISKNQLPKDITGIGPIKLGVKRGEIQKYLLPGKFFSYTDQLTAKAENVPLSEEVFDKNTYKVNISLKQFSTYSGVPVKLMELFFDENDVLTDILVIFADTPMNKKTLTTAVESKWGKTIGSVGIDEVTGEPNDNFFFIWEYTGGKTLFMNFNNKVNYPNSDKVIYLNFSTDN